MLSQLYFYKVKKKKPRHDVLLWSSEGTQDSTDNAKGREKGEKAGLAEN